MLVIGDVHGHYDRYVEILKSAGDEHTVQLGDLGIGFPNRKRVVDEVVVGEQRLHWTPMDWFFAGNHDNRKVMKNMGGYLGDFGIRTLGGVKFFFLSGAYSIDKSLRTPGLDWWEDEELSMDQLTEALEMYEREKPDIVISHDCPMSIQPEVLRKLWIGEPSITVYPSRTSRCLQFMFEAHQPSLWVFGHYHVNWSRSVGRTTFHCLGELQTMRVLP